MDFGLLPDVDEVGAVLDTEEEDNDMNAPGEGAAVNAPAADAGWIERTFLANNNPNLIILAVKKGGFLPAEGEWESAGESVAKHTTLKELALSLDGVEVAPNELEKFVRGAARSRSLQKVTLSGLVPIGVGSVEEAAPHLFNTGGLFRHLVCLPQNVGRVTIETTKSGGPALLVILIRQLAPSEEGFNSLRLIKVQEIKGRPACSKNSPEQIINAAAGQLGLKRLIMWTQGEGSAVAFLVDNEGDELVVLDLYGNCISKGHEALLAEIVKAPPEVQTVEWQAVASLLTSPLFRLAQLSFPEDDVVDHSRENLFVGLKSLNLGRHSKSVYFPNNGWVALFDYLQKPTCVLEDLDMSMGCTFTDEESANLFDALKNNASLKSLNLAGCLRQATGRTWSSVSAMLESEETVLEKLNLCYSPVNNDALYAFSCNLAVNNTMKELLLYNDPDWNTEWKAYERVLCNKTSINHTFDSNHTLTRVVNNKKQPKGIAGLLEMNKGKYTFDTARRKIIDVHFPEGFVGADPFVDMEVNVMPRALAWMAWGGKSGQVEGHFYTFLKSVPTLFGVGSEGKKRKRGD